MTYIDILRLTGIRTITLITQTTALHVAIVDQVAHRVRLVRLVSVLRAEVKVNLGRFNSITRYDKNYPLYIALYKKLFFLFFSVYNPYSFLSFCHKE